MYKIFFKRLFDIIFALAALPFMIIIFIIVAPLIYLQDKGSVFYNAPRLGKDGKQYKMFKFRTMKMNAPDIRNDDGSTFNSEDDPRLTKIGKLLRKTSIDETPQIFNILNGEMSFIGPRPDLPEHIDVYDAVEIQKISVRPGITGYNQAYFRNSINYRMRWLNDVYYVNNVTFLLDLKILFKTILTVLHKDGVFITANSPEQSGEKQHEE